MQKLQKSSLSYLFSSFLEEFYNGAPIYRDSLLTKTMILPNQPGSTNAFLHDVGDYIFKKGNKCTHNVVESGLVKSGDFFKQYCDMVKLIKISSTFENFFASERYKNLSKEIKEWEAIYGKALFELEENKNDKIQELNKNLKAWGKSPEEIKGEVDDFLSWYRDPKNAGIMEDASNNIKALKITREQMLDQAAIPRPAMMIYDGRIMCSDAERHDAKNMYNMLVEGASFGGYFEPMIRGNSATLKTIGKSLELSKADNYLNKQDVEGKIALKLDSSNKDAEKYMDQKTLPSGAAVVNDLEREKELAAKQEECAKKKNEMFAIFGAREQKNCELELNKLEKLFYKTIHGQEYENLKKESLERKEKALKKFQKFSEDEKLEQCKDNNYVKYFSESSLKSWEISEGASGNVGVGNALFGVGLGGQVGGSAQDTTQSTDVSCISFKGVHAIPIRYPWLDKNIYKLDLSNKGHGVYLDLQDFKYEDYKDFLLDRCIIPKSVIVGAGMRAHFKKNLLKAFDVDASLSVQVNDLLWNVKAESKGGYSSYDQNTGGFDIYEPDLLVVLGYELEDMCPKADSPIFQVQCSNYHDEL